MFKSFLSGVCVFGCCLGMAAQGLSQAPEADQGGGPELVVTNETYWEELQEEDVNRWEPRLFEMSVGFGVDLRVGGNYSALSRMVYSASSAPRFATDFEFACFPWRNWGVYLESGSHSTSWDRKLDMERLGLGGYYLGSSDFSYDGSGSSNVGYLAVGVAYRLPLTERFMVTGQLGYGSITFDGVSRSVWAKQPGTNSIFYSSVYSMDESVGMVFPKVMCDYQFARHFSLRASLGWMVPVGHVGMSFSTMDVYQLKTVRDGNSYVYPGTVPTLGVGVMWKFGPASK